MGLIKAGTGALGGTLADQWKEFFYCDSLTSDTLIIKGQKRSGNRSSNTKGNDNIISNGSGIAVADGQCMIIVDQGKIVEICAESGEFTWDSSTEPSIFTGKLSDSIKKSFAAVGKRFTYSGDTGKDQRVYYFNTKEILENKFGTPNPFMFDVVNKEIGMTRTVQVRCNGIYTYRITDPVLFYTNVAGMLNSHTSVKLLTEHSRPNLLMLFSLRLQSFRNWRFVLRRFPHTQRSIKMPSIMLLHLFGRNAEVLRSKIYP